MPPAPAMPAANVFCGFADCRRQSQTGKTGKKSVKLCISKGKNHVKIIVIPLWCKTFSSSMFVSSEKWFFCKFFVPFKKLFQMTLNYFKGWGIKVTKTYVIFFSTDHIYSCFCFAGFADLPVAKGKYIAGASGNRNYRQNGMYKMGTTLSYNFTRIPMILKKIALLS